MKILTESLEYATQGFSDVIDITDDVARIVAKSRLKEGSILLFVVGSTAALTTLEYEPALVEDLKELLEKLAPTSMHSRHSATWGDDNGFSHLRATLMGPGTTLPVVGGEILLGTWQQVVLIDHDNRPRSRGVRIQVVG